MQPGDDLRVALPDVPHEETRVETDDTGETFFVVDDFPTLRSRACHVAGAAAHRHRLGREPQPRRRRSRARSRHHRRAPGEARQRRGPGDRLSQRAGCAAPVPIIEGEADALVAYLREQPCDGATNLAALRFPADVAYTLLFSDGLSTVGGGANDGPVHPVFVLSGDPRADHARLRAMAQRTGGAYFNLQRTRTPTCYRTRTASALAAVGRCRPRCRGRSRAVRRAGGHRWACAHRRPPARAQRAPDAALRLAGPAAARDANDRVAAPAISKATGLVAQLWAQQRMATLGVDPEANHDDLVRLGQRFSIVTPGTSLLVLETLEQYLEHDVTPPVTSPELRTAFLERQSQERVAKSTRSETRRRASSRCGSAAWRGGRASSTILPTSASKSRSSQIASGLPKRYKAVWRAVSHASCRRRRRGRARWLRRPRARRGARARPATVSRGDAPSPTVNAADAAAARGEEADAAALRIAIKPWNPDTPYLRSLRAERGDAYRRYLAERDTYGGSPAFYLDCADYLFEHGQRDLALRVLTNVAELKLEDARLLRVLAHRLEQVDELDLAVELFDRVRRLRPEEPQSYRDLALALDRRAGARGALTAASIDDYARALALFCEIVDREWDGRFPEIEVIALIEANRIPRCSSAMGRRARGRSTRGCGACSTSTSASC